MSCEQRVRTESRLDITDKEYGSARSKLNDGCHGQARSISLLSVAINEEDKRGGGRASPRQDFGNRACIWDELTGVPQRPLRTMMACGLQGWVQMV